MDDSKNISLTPIEAAYAVAGLRVMLDTLKTYPEKDRRKVASLLIRLVPLIDLSERNRKRILKDCYGIVPIK